MEGRRIRRQSRTRAQTLLPLRSTRLSNTLSCWYCDLKMTCLNKPLYHFGQKHARFLKVWFTVGTGFSLSMLLGVTMVLIWQAVTTSWLTRESNKLTHLFDSLLFGVNPWAMRFKMSLADLGYMVGATIISVTVHEFGHASAAASEGIELEYIAIFLAILFPGALVAFNYELLHSKPRSTALRIYCAGIWHNAVVVDVSASSPLSGYLSPGDNIVSLEGVKMFSAVDWMEMASSLEKRSLASSEFEVLKGYPVVNKSYCAPNVLVQNSERLFSVSNHSACPDEHVAFVSTPCFDLRSHSAGTGYCLGSTDAVSLKSCGSLGMSETTCVCSENEMCLSPVQEPGVVWAEITYRSPRNHQCNSSTSDGSDSRENCHKSFLYVGDAFSMTRSLKLTSYQPRFTFPFATYLPDMFENILVWTFKVSLALALLNSLPVYCLDGESILEVSSLYVTVFSPRKRRLFLQVSLFGGSVLACLVFLRTLLIQL
ncbi:membrane-bound transcription factor site-2 protease homolog isoform X2 [Silene latifolia]|uniref:membrane-bound transcription factor site-2 protease homolog isoform X2 n=1 Tax=Silene latifolia TaxID=37657 RepID=UPI003D780450